MNNAGEKQPQRRTSTINNLAFLLHLLPKQYIIKKSVKVIHTQLTRGGNSEADIATPINGPAEFCSRATATPLPEVNAHKTPIHNERALPLTREKI